MHKISFYVPKSHLEIVKNALFDVGAGKYAQYDRCCWQTEGIGQYRPLEKSQPFKGEIQVVTHEAEFLVEMICEDDLIDKVIDTLITAHPYETPAFSAWPIRVK